MPDKTVRALGRGCLVRVALLAIAATGALTLFGGAVVLGAVLPLPAAAEPLRPYLEWALQVGAFLVFVVATFAASAAIVVRRAHHWEDAFAGLGVMASPFFSGRAFHGAWGGRRLDAYVFRGSSVEIHLEAHVGARVAVAQESAGTLIARVLFDKPLVPWEAPGFEDLEVHADDAAWATALLADPVAVVKIPGLTRDDLGPERRLLVIGPEAVSLRMRYLPDASVTATNVLHWVEDLAEIARRAEEVAPPAREERETAWERRWRTERGSFWAPIGWLTVVATVALAVLTLLTAVRMLLQSLG